MTFFRLNRFMHCLHFILTNLPFCPFALLPFCPSVQTDTAPNAAPYHGEGI
jgi:hypothetical protein